MDLAQLPHLAAVFGLTMARVSSALVASPLFGEQRGPRVILVGLSGWVSICLLLARPLPAEPDSLLLAALGESVLGLLLGFTLRLALLPLEVVGELGATEAGLSLASTFDPARAEPATVLSTLLRGVGLLLFCGAGGPELLLGLVGRTFELFPAGAAGGTSLRPAVLALVPTLVARALLAAVELGLPVLLSSFLASAALAVLSRAAPRLNLFSDTYPLRTLSALVALLLTLPWLPRLVSAGLHQASSALGLSGLGLSALGG